MFHCVSYFLLEVDTCVSLCVLLYTRGRHLCFTMSYSILEVDTCVSLCIFLS